MQIYGQIDNKDSFVAKIQRTKKQISELLIDEEKHLLDDYETAMTNQPMSVVAQSKNFSSILAVARLYGKKSWLKMTEKEMAKLGADIMHQYSPDNKETNTTYDCKKILRLWFRFIKTGHRELKKLQLANIPEPRELVHINPSRVDDKIAREQLITPEELSKILAATKTIRDKALIYVHWNLGTRIGETLSIQLKHIKQEKNWITIYVDGKTGTRKVRVIEAKESLIAWLNQHPAIDNPEAPLWVNQHQNGQYEAIGYEGSRKILLTALKNAKIQRRIYWHLMRHTAATRAATKYKESALKKMFGWSATSKMVARYTHIVDEDVDDAVREAYGFEKNDTSEFDMTKSTPCSNCSQMIDFEAKFCKNCGQPKNDKTAIDLDDTTSEMERVFYSSKEDIIEMVTNQLAAKLLSDPESLKKILLETKQFKSIN